MKVTRLDKFTETSALRLCELFDLQEIDSPANETILCGDFLTTMLQKNCFVDSIHFLACGLPKREAIWWSCVCVRVLCGDELSSSELSALKAAEAWVKQPNEERRYETEHLNQVLMHKSPAGWSAQAVFWSGDSVVARGQPKVAPDPQLTARAVSGAVQLAVVQQPQALVQRYKECIKRGVDIANGGNGQIQVTKEVME